jgi:hypothetical protein
MTTAILYVEDVDQSAEYFADIEGMDLDAKRNVLDTICDALSTRTGHDVDWSNHYHADGWTIIDGDEEAVRVEMNLAIERIVNDPDYTGPNSL